MNTPTLERSTFVIKSILHAPVALAQQVVGGVARTGLQTAGAVVDRFRPGSNDHARATAATAPVDAEPVQQPASTPTRPEPVAPVVPTQPASAEQPAATKTSTPKAPKPKPPVKKAATSAPKKTTANKTTPAKPTPKKPAPKKPAAVLDEDPAPVADDPIVYSSGPEVTTTVAAELDDRP